MLVIEQDKIEINFICFNFYIHEHWQSNLFAPTPDRSLNGVATCAEIGGGGGVQFPLEYETMSPGIWKVLNLHVDLNLWKIDRNPIPPCGNCGSGLVYVYQYVYYMYKDIHVYGKESPPPPI